MKEFLSGEVGGLKSHPGLKSHKELLMSMTWEEQAKVLFENKVQEVAALNCMVKLKLDKKRRYIDELGCYTAEIFNIRGTRIFLLVKKNGWSILNPSVRNTGRTSEVTPSAVLSWKIKKKNIKRYNSINFEDVLDSALLSGKAKEELVFNLDVFLNRS